MNSANSIRQASIVAAIRSNPGITKPQLMSRLDIGLKALEMHLTRIVGAGLAHSRPISGEKKLRGWHPGEPNSVMRRATSVFDLGMLEAA